MPLGFSNPASKGRTRLEKRKGDPPMTPGEIRKIWSTWSPYIRQIRNPLNRSQHSTGTLIPTCTINIAFSFPIQRRESDSQATGDLLRSANDTDPTMVWCTNSEASFGRYEV